MTWIRVEDRDTGHEYDVDARSFDEALHKKVNKPAQYPDLDGPGARPRPTKYRTTKGAATAASTQAGQPAAPKENSR